MLGILNMMKQFQSQEDCIEHLENIRFGEQPYCPHCGGIKVGRKKENDIIGRWNCYECGSSYNVMSGTIFQGTRHPLMVWFLAIVITLHSKNGVSSNEMAEYLGISQKGALGIQIKIREEFLREESSTKLNGLLEADETYLNIRTDKEYSNGRGTNKLAVLGVIERGGQVVTKVAEDITSDSIYEFISNAIKVKGLTLITDGLRSYCRLSNILEHKILTRRRRKFKNGINTNSMEGYWRHLKRRLYGTHFKWSIERAELYLAESCYIYNHRFYNRAKVFYSFLCHSVESRELIPRWDT